MPGLSVWDHYQYHFLCDKNDTALIFQILLDADFASRQDRLIMF